jgi:ankyrin repeat protein
MDNLEDTPQTSGASDQAQTSRSDATGFESSSPKRATTEYGHSFKSQAKNENISASTEPPASQSQSLFCGSIKYKGSGMKNSLHGVAYQLKLIMLFIIRGLDNGHPFRLAGEMDDAKKFDDIVFRYADQGREVIRFLQAKHKQGQISKTDLLNETDGDFSLQKYFISYRKISQNPVFNGAECKDFIIFTNIDLNDGLYDLFEPIGGIDPILSMARQNVQGRTAKLLRMKLTDLKSDREELLQNLPDLQLVKEALLLNLYNASDIRRLARRISECADGENKTPLLLKDTLLITYHRALAENVIDMKHGKYKDSFIDGDTHLTEDVKKFRALLNTGKLSEDEFRKKLSACTFTIQEAFAKLQSKEQNHLLPNDEVRREEVMGFLGKLVFAVNQPNEIELGEILKSEIREFHIFNLSDVDLITSDVLVQIIDWMKMKRGLFLSNEHCDKLLNGVQRKIAKLMVAGVTKGQRNKLDNIGISFSNDQESLNKFLANSEKQIFNLIVQGSSTLGSLIVHQTMNNFEDVDYRKDDSCIFVSLGCLLHLKMQVKEAFQSTKLLVIEYEDLQADITQKYFGDLCDILESHSDKKCVCITHDNDSSKNHFPFQTNRKLRDRYEEKTVKLSFTDLTTISQEKLSILTKIIFQGQTVSLADLVSKYGQNLTHTIDREMLRKIIDHEEIHLGKPLPSLGEVRDYYIHRTLIRAVRIRPDLEKDSSLLIVSNISDASELQLNKLEILKKGIVLISNSSTVFDQLRDDHTYNECNVHWLKQDSDGLKWQRSHGKISALRGSIMNEGHDEIIISQITQIPDKLVIISAEPGMGKSTLLTKLANNTKNTFPTEWIIRINLNNCTRDLEALDNHIDKVKALEFLLRAAHIESNFEKAFFNYIMEKQQCIMLLIDGFDDISPYYKQKVFDLILAYRNTKIFGIWITTRPHLKQELEDKFGEFAYTLKPIRKEDQEYIIKGFWGFKTGLKINPDQVSHIDEYIEKILNLFSKSIADNPMRQFVGIPLQTVLLAEYFYETAKMLYTSEDVFVDLPSRLNILDLYTHFVEKKYHIYSVEKKGEELTNVAIKDDNDELYEIFLNRHENYALNTLFGEDEVKSFRRDHQGGRQPTKSAPKVERTGIIVEVVNERPIFVHRTFAEYFAASWFAKNMDNLRDKKFLRTLFRFGYETLRNFFDRILCKENCKLHNDVLNGDKANINELLLSGEVDIKAVDGGGRTAMHLAAICGDEDVVNILLNHGADVSARDDLFGWCAAVYADRCGKFNVAILLLQKMEPEPEILLIIKHYYYYQRSLFQRNDFFEYGFNLLPLAVQNDDVEFVEFLNRNEFCFDMGSMWGPVSFIKAVENGRKQIVQIMVESCYDNCQMVRELINSTDDYGNNSVSICLYSSSKDCEEVCEYLIKKYVATLSVLKQSNPVSYFSELASFFNLKNKSGETPLLKACANNAIKCGKLLVNKYVEYASELKSTSLSMYYDQLDNFFNAKNKNGLTPVHLAVMRHNLEFVYFLTDSYFNALDSIQSSDSELNQNHLLKFLNGVDNEGNTPLCAAIYRWLDDDGIREYLTRKNLQIIAPLNEEDTDLYRGGFRIMHDIISSRDKYGLTPLLLAAQGPFKLNIVKFLVEFYSDALDLVNLADREGNREKLLAFINVADNHGNTLLCLASERGDRDLCDYLISKHLSILLPLEAENADMYRDGLRNLFFYTNFNGDTPLALACAGDQFQLDCIKVWIRRYNNYSSYLKTTEDENKAEVVKRYLETTNKNGMTPLTLAESSVKDWIDKFCKRLQ